MIFQCILTTQPPLTEALSCGLQSLVYFKTHHPDKYETCQIGLSSMDKTSLSTVQKSSVLCLQKCTHGPMNNSKFARLHIIAKKRRGQQMRRTFVQTCRCTGASAVSVQSSVANKMCSSDRSLQFILGKMLKCIFWPCVM